MQPILRVWGIRLIWLIVALSLVLVISHIPAGLGSHGVVQFTSRETLARQEYQSYAPARNAVDKPFILPSDDVTGVRAPIEWSFQRFRTKTHYYLVRLVRGELFVTVRNLRGQFSIVPMQKLLADGWKRSVGLFLGAITLGLVLGGLLGCVAAFSRVLRSVSLGISITGLSIPDFLLVQFGWVLTIWTFIHFNFRLWSITGDSKTPWLFPLLVLSIAPMGYGARLTTNGLDEVLRQDYIRTARSKGLRNWSVIMGHGFRNALPQVLNGLPALVQITLSSLIIVETMTSYPGLGAGLVDITDSEVATTTAMIFCIWYVAMDGVAQTLRILANPRLQEVV